jgi:hypothetical protein
LPLLILAALTISPLVLTWAPLKKVTPDWLISTTCPLASMRPAICDGSPPVTRFTVTDEGAG